MTKFTKEALNALLQDLDSMSYIKADDIPEIDLYMDQVTTFMDAHLGSTKRSPEDKVLTKTMINNYAKNNLLPPPVKKKYSKDHMMVLTLIYYLKNVLSIKDIESILKPLTQQYFANDEQISLEAIYEQIRYQAKEQMTTLRDDLNKSFTAGEEALKELNLDEEKHASLELFTIIANLSFDVYMKKYLIERLIDQITEEEEKK
ncbi:DUF1836 domain-containing protein [Lachnospiraceae bacterium OttesenSCG-928-J05]|nr:DUF1836 domain-containing protein [Lachnospiraceae bacterium OttesenSCG-928-J05]